MIVLTGLSDSPMIDRAQALNVHTVLATASAAPRDPIFSLTHRPSNS